MGLLSPPALMYARPIPTGLGVLLLRAYALCHTGYSVGHRGHLYRGYLHDLLARFRQSGADLRETIEAQSGQGLCFILCTTPAPDHNWEGRKPGPQPFIEIARLGKASRRHEPNTDERWCVLLHQ